MQNKFLSLTLVIVLLLSSVTYSMEEQNSANNQQNKNLSKVKNINFYGKLSLKNLTIAYILNNKPELVSLILKNMEDLEDSFNLILTIENNTIENNYTEKEKEIIISCMQGNYTKPQDKILLQELNHIYFKAIVNNHELIITYLDKYIDSNIVSSSLDQTLVLDSYKLIYSSIYNIDQYISNIRQAFGDKPIVLKPCLLALLNGHTNLVKFFLEKNIDQINDWDNLLGNTLLQHAISAANLDIINLILSFKPNVNALSLGSFGFSALHSAVSILKKQDRADSVIAIISALLNSGADINIATATDGITPLMFACVTGCTKVVKFLLDRGANKNMIDVGGKTALDYALIKNNIEIVKTLKD